VRNKAECGKPLDAENRWGEKIRSVGRFAGCETSLGAINRWVGKSEAEPLIPGPCGRLSMKRTCRGRGDRLDLMIERIPESSHAVLK
jgi:hypothetical protein